jgi:membrane protein YdbS with pleckstrin-like domain
VTRREIINHVLLAVGLLVAVGLIGLALGLNNGTWWLLGAVVVLLHVGVFAALITWVVQRVRRLRRERVEP